MPSPVTPTAATSAPIATRLWTVSPQAAASAPCHAVTGSDTALLLAAAAKEKACSQQERGGISWQEAA